MKSLKKIGLISAAFAALAISGAALAQVTLPYVQSISPTDAFQDIQNGTPLATNYYATAAQLRSWFLGQSIHTGTPTLTTSTSICGGTTNTAISGTDVSGQVTEGTSASTSCVITFAKAFVTAPECFVSINNVADSSLKCSTSTTALTVTQTSASSNVLNYLVIGLAGG